MNRYFAQVELLIWRIRLILGRVPIVIKDGSHLLSRTLYMIISDYDYTLGVRRSLLLLKIFTIWWGKYLSPNWWLTISKTLLWIICGYFVEFWSLFCEGSFMIAKLMSLKIDLWLRNSWIVKNWIKEFRLLVHDFDKLDDSKDVCVG